MPKTLRSAWPIGCVTAGRFKKLDPTRLGSKLGDRTGRRFEFFAMVEETGVEPVSRNLRPERLQACPVYLSLGPSPTHRQERSTGPTRFNLASGPPGEVPLASPYSRRLYPALQAPQERRSRVLSRESVIGVGDYYFSQFFYEVPRKPRPAALTSTIPVETVSPPGRVRSSTRAQYRREGRFTQARARRAGITPAPT